MFESDRHTILEIDSDSGELSGELSMSNSVGGTIVPATVFTLEENSKSLDKEYVGSDSEERTGAFDYYPRPTVTSHKFPEKSSETIKSAPYNELGSDQIRYAPSRGKTYNTDRHVNSQYVRDGEDSNQHDWTRASEFSKAGGNSTGTNKEDADDGIELKTVRPLFPINDQDFGVYLSRNNIDYLCERTEDKDRSFSPASFEKNRETPARSEFQAHRDRYGTFGPPPGDDVEDHRYGGSDAAGGMSSFAYSASSRTTSGSSDGYWPADADDRYGYSSGRSEVNSNAEQLAVSDMRLHGSGRSQYNVRGSRGGELMTNTSIISSAADCDADERSHFLTESRLSAVNSERNESRPILYFPECQMFNNGSFLDGSGTSASLLAERAEVTRRMQRKKLKKQLADGKFTKSEDCPEYKGDMTVEEVLEFINRGLKGRRGLSMDDTSGPAGELVGKADKPLVKKSKKRLNGTQSDSTAGTQSDSIDATPSSSNAAAPSFSDAAKDKVEATQLYIDPGDIEPTYQTVTASKVYTTSSSVNDSSNERFHLSTRENLKITEASLPDLKGDTINLSANNDSTTIRQLAQCTGTNGWRVEKDESSIDDDASLHIVHKIAIASSNKLSSNKTVEFNDTNSETDSVVSSVQESSMSDVAIMQISGKEIEFTTVRKKKKVPTATLR